MFSTPDLLTISQDTDVRAISDIAYQAVDQIVKGMSDESNDATYVYEIMHEDFDFLVGTHQTIVKCLNSREAFDYQADGDILKKANTEKEREHVELYKEVYENAGWESHYKLTVGYENGEHFYNYSVVGTEPVGISKDEANQIVKDATLNPLFVNPQTENNYLTLTDLHVLLNKVGCALNHNELQMIGRHIIRKLHTESHESKLSFYYEQLNRFLSKVVNPAFF